MTSIFKRIKLFRKNEQGVTAVEYALLAAMVGVAIVTMAPDFRSNLSNAFTNIFSPTAAG